MGDLDQNLQPRGEILWRFVSQHGLLTVTDSDGGQGWAGVVQDLAVPGLHLRPWMPL